MSAGIDEKDMEAKLSNWFDLAEIWGSVMLIDEADVYLETRTTSDLQRNSLVSGKGPFLIWYHMLIMFLSLSPSYGVLSRYPVPYNKQSWSH